MTPRRWYVHGDRSSHVASLVYCEKCHAFVTMPHVTGLHLRSVVQIRRDLAKRQRQFHGRPEWHRPADAPNVFLDGRDSNS